ncbi:hypothetical protein PybrP1_005340 [[Pythium] brassicae (nom. inval.)]|nr:hypothetical protein PybrP1_005340 [[Pythium] brassicae (nom. inval.)]
MDNNDGLPQCMPLMRLHELLLNGTLGEQAQHALEHDKRHSAQYEALRRCDGAFRALEAASDPQQQQQAAADGDGSEAPKTPEALYAEYVQCTSSALCPSALHEWRACAQQPRGDLQALERCAVAKRLLERCLRGEARSLLRASQPDVFPRGGGL